MTAPRHDPLQRVLLVGDSYGVPELLTRVPVARVAAVVAAVNRPHCHDELREHAARAGVPMLVQPRAETQEYAQFVRDAATLRPDSLLCHSYAMRIRRDVLELVHGRAFNVHAALLPRHRGPNPIQWALIHGDAHTGVTLHVMDDDFDHGAVVAQASLAIQAHDTWQTLAARVRRLTTTLLDDTLPTLLSGDWTEQTQDESLAIRNPRIGPDSLPIDLATMSDQQIVDLIRAQVAPLNGAYLHLDGQLRRFTDPLTIDDVAQLRHSHRNNLHV